MTVAIEYHLTASPVMTDTEALDYFAGMLGCDDRRTDTFAAGPVVQIDTDMDTADEYPHMAEVLGGMLEFLSVLFRQVKNLGDLGDANAVGDMLTAVVRFFEDFPDAQGVFAFNFETILVQRLGGEGIVLDRRLLESDGYNRHGTLDDLLAKYPVREIDQALR
jgi:hypothetical protein